MGLVGYAGVCANVNAGSRNIAPKIAYLQAAREVWPDDIIFCFLSSFSGFPNQLYCCAFDNAAAYFKQICNVDSAISNTNCSLSVGCPVAAIHP
jgi:hypothetical protein